jgi:hypothetical protein
MKDGFNTETFRRLCDEASAERNSQRLLELTQKIKEMLEEKFDFKKDPQSKKKSA